MLIPGSLTSIRCGNHLLDLSVPVVMGVINVTPDSFYAPSRMAPGDGQMVDIAGKMLASGAAILDIGGMSSRPGSTPVEANEEEDRVLPVIEMLMAHFPAAIISVDTYRAGVAKSSILAGATIVNDISGGTLDQDMWDVISSHKVAYCLMHMRGTPSDMQSQTEYQDLISDLLKYFVNKLTELHRLGIRDIIIDPGFGFAKTMEQNYQLIQHLDVFRTLGYPVLIGVSRKSTLSKTINRPVEETLSATTALHMVALLKGASILRVHDVQPAMDAIAVYVKLRDQQIH